MRIVVAPDSFKGTLEAPAAAAAIAEGWRLARPDDVLVELPLADGGEGTLTALRLAHPGAAEQACRVTGPDGRGVDASWLLLPDGTAVVELATASGLPLMSAPDPLGAHTLGFGSLLAAAARDPRVSRILATVGGSASTDGGVGALTALGMRFLDDRGRSIGLGGAGLCRLARIDASGLVPAPARGVALLTDVDAPLLGPRGAAHQFGPQKGATPAEVGLLEAGLARLARFVGEDSTPAGAGAAGGTAYGLVALWGAVPQSGAAAVGAAVGLDGSIEAADLVVTGEGQLDGQSLGGKVVGHVLGVAAARGRPVWGCVGRRVGGLPPGMTRCTSLVDLAGSPAAAMAEPARWLREAGRHLAALYRVTR